MPLSQFDNNDKINLDAAAEQLAIIVALGYKGEAELDKLISLCPHTTNVLDRYLTPEVNTGEKSFLPSYQILQQQGQFWITIAGTQGWQQWTSHGVGFFFRKSFPVANSGVYAHSYMLGIADTLLQKFAELVPFYSGQPINIAGHSLGGGAGQLLGYRIKKFNPNTKVKLLTFGQPRVLAGRSSTLTAPDVFFRCVNGYDPITVTPWEDGPNENLQHTHVPRPGVIAVLDDRLSFLPPGSQGWQDFGDEVDIDSDGELRSPRQRPAPASTPGSGSWNESIYHPSPAYLRSFANAANRYGAAEASRAFTNVVWPLIQTKTDKSEYNLPDPGPYLEVAEANRVIVGSTTGPINAGNAGTVAMIQIEVLSVTRQHGSLFPVFAAFGSDSAMPDTITWHVNIGYELENQGWSEDHYLTGNLNPTPNPQHPMIESYCKARDALLGKGAKIQFVRVNNVAVPGFSVPEDRVGRYNTDKGVGMDAADSYCAAVIPLYNSTFEFRRLLTLKGFPAKYLGQLWQEEHPFVQAQLDFPAEKPDTLLSDLLTVVKSKVGTVSWAIRHLVTPDPSAQKRIQVVATEPTTREWYVTLEDDIWKVGDTIHIHGAKGNQGIRGFNGTHRIISTTTNPKVFVLNTRACGDCPPVFTYKGNYYPPSYAYAPITNANLGWFSKRNMHAAFFPQLGRPKKKCC